MTALTRTEISGLNFVARGKVRDIYEYEDKLVLVATDRISAYDVVLPTPIPDKGKILTQISGFWFNKVESITSHHLITTVLPESPAFQTHRSMLEDRTMIVRRATVLPVEFVVRAYIFGTAYDEYLRNGTACGIPLPSGLKLAGKLSSPILTPSTKSKNGHDINITHEEAINITGEQTFREIERRSIQIFELAYDFLRNRDILLCDTKFEFGFIDGQLCLLDEILTPDSSRFWDAELYQEGESPKSFDKQFIRDYLVDVRWDKKPPAPILPDEIVKKTRDRYLEAYKRIIGHTYGNIK